jgi:hypothetical protein
VGFAPVAISGIGADQRVSGHMIASVLALPLPGAPVSFDQFEERSRRLEESSSPAKAHETRIDRESSGRLRIHGTIGEGSGHSPLSSEVIQIIDPVAALRFVLLSNGTEKLAYRVPWPKSPATGFGFFFFADDPGAASREFTFRTESLGTRMIEGIEFQGSRMIREAAGEPQLTKTVEQWHSSDLNLIGLLLVVATNELYTAQIQGVRREEPDPVLFAVPPNYRILDLPTGNSETLAIPAP